MIEDFSVLGLIFIPSVFFISRKVLREKKSSAIILVICILLAGLSFFKTKTDYYKPDFSLFWLCPIYAFIVYRLLLTIFWKRKKRDPQIPGRVMFYRGDLNLLADKLFGFMFILLSILVPMTLIYFI